MDRQLSDFSDLELAKVTGQLYNELMQVQTNIFGINQELARREILTKARTPLMPKEEGDK